MILDFWLALVSVLPKEWADARHHMLTKGIGVYALMRIAADILDESRSAGRPCDRRAFTIALSDFAGAIDWSTTGPLKGFGGQGGVKAAVEYISRSPQASRIQGRQWLTKAFC